MDLLDAISVPLAAGQRVVYATVGLDPTGQLVPATIVRVRFRTHAGRPAERIFIRSDDGRLIVLWWSERVLVLRQESAGQSLGQSGPLRAHTLFGNLSESRRAGVVKPGKHAALKMQCPQGLGGSIPPTGTTT